MSLESARENTGFVALLDVLGFRNLISGPSSAADLARYLTVVTNVSEEISRATARTVRFVLFSDSIIVTAAVNGEDGAASLRLILRACSRLVGVLLEHEIPVRGAISHGTFIRQATDNGVFVAGRPIVEAYEFEQRQKWVGVMLTPSVLVAQPKLAGWCALPRASSTIDKFRARLPWIALVRRYKTIPCDDGPYDGFAVVPTPQPAEAMEVDAYLKTCERKVDILKRLAGTHAAQQKYVETDKWLSTLRADWKSVSGKPGLPARINYDPE
jgi:hypothetical protein